MCIWSCKSFFWEKQFIGHGKKKWNWRLTKGVFSELFSITLVNAIKPENIISGFKTTGIFPVDSTKLPRHEFTLEDLAEYDLKSSTSNRNSQNKDLIHTETKEISVVVQEYLDVSCSYH